ncbi:MAG: glycerate kinase [Galbitalea sp.]
MPIRAGGPLPSTPARREGSGSACSSSACRSSRGARTVGENIGLPAAVASADLVITGEGRFDDQTASGKVAHYVATLSSALGVPTALVAGSVAAPTDAFADAISLVALTGDETAARADTEHWLTEAGAVLARRMA